MQMCIYVIFKNTGMYYILFYICTIYMYYIYLWNICMQKSNAHKFKLWPLNTYIISAL